MQDHIKQAQHFVESDEDALSNGLAIAELLRELHCDETVITAGILYPFIAKNPALSTLLHEQFGKSIHKIITGALQMDVISHTPVGKDRIAGKTAQQNQIDNLRKMMLAMADDIRIVLMKLCERLVSLQKAQTLSSELRTQIAQETMDYYAPLANRLGVGFLKWQLEDLGFCYTKPQDYERISKAVNMRRHEREKIIRDMIAELKQLLEKEGLPNAAITGRAKHLYSIYLKLTRKQLDFKHLYDASALRILVPAIVDCYTALSIVHAQWTPITEQFDDYIAKPKPNGYQSIHTAVMRDDGTPIEIQIRTFDMHESSELGVAAHWKYKEKKSVGATDEQKIVLLRELLDWQKNTLHDETQSELYRAAFSDRVYVFSPNGDVFDLQQGATPLDFAYLIHSEVGHRCRGAKVNDVLVPLTHELQTSDRITILTTKEAHPSRDWVRPELGYLKTPHAKQKVRQWFHKIDYEKNLELGDALWEKACLQHDIEPSDIEKVFSEFNLKNTEALLVAIAAGNITPTAVVNKILALQKHRHAPESTVSSPMHDTTPSKTDFSVMGAKHLLTQLAKCCHPIPGDEIIGYITKGRGISVHQKKCRNMADALMHRPEKLIPISWENQLDRSYRVNLAIECEDRAGLLRDVSGLLAQMNLSIFALTSHVNAQNNTGLIEVTIEIKNRDLLDSIMRKVRQISGVSGVKRK